MLAGLVGLAPARAQEAPETGNKPVFPDTTPFEKPEGITEEAVLDAKVVDKAGNSLPLDATFDLSTGEKVRFGDLLTPGRPLLLQFAYFRCPSLCTVTLNSMVDLLKSEALKLKPGQDFDVITLSINPQETSNLARLKKRAYLDQLGKPDLGDGWRFLTGSRSQIRAIAEAAGFGYRFETETREFAHGAAIFTVTPEGTISRTIPGAFWSPGTVRLSLVEAADGGIGSPLDQILLYCYHFDPGTGQYTAQIMNITRLVGLLSILFVGTFVGSMFWRERLNRRDAALRTDLETQSVTEQSVAPASPGGVA